MRGLKIPQLDGIIRARLLLNYRVDPDVVRPLLPEAFAPLTVNGAAVAGVCVIRLEKVRPKILRWFPPMSFISLAHRVAVQWRDQAGLQSGVYIWRRVTDSRLVALAGGRVFPGSQSTARVRLQVDHRSVRAIAVSGEGTILSGLFERGSNRGGGSLFSDHEKRERFFAAGGLGVSPARGGKGYDGMRLEVENWNSTLVEAVNVSSEFFDNSDRFPRDGIAFDHAMLMENLNHTWTHQSLRPADAPVATGSVCVSQRSGRE